MKRKPLTCLVKQRDVVSVSFDNYINQLQTNENNHYSF